MENKADVHAQTQTGDTALTYACENGHTDVAEVLLYYGAELEHESEGGRTPLMKACRAGHICTVKFLIQKGADVNRQTTNNDHTPLSLACAGGHQQVVELLLTHGADPFHKLKDNSTMLIEAAKGGHTGVVQLLLDFPPNTLPSTSQTQQSAQLQQPLSMVHMRQKQQIKQLQHQQQHLISQNQPLLNAPPGIHEVTEIRLPDPPGMFQQHIINENLDQHHANKAIPLPPQIPNQNFIIDPTMPTLGHPANVEQTESILAQMKLLQSAGYKGGLTYGLTKAQSNAVNQIINNNTNNVMNSASQQMIQNNLCLPTQSTSNNKQKNLLRKNNRQTSPFENNLSSAEQQLRSQPIGEDDSSTYIRSCLEDQIQQKVSI